MTDPLMTFIDSTAPMYMVGQPGPERERSEELVERALAGGETLVTDVEVYQEILHRFTAIRRPVSIDDAFNTLDEIVTHIFTYDMDDVRLARAILHQVPGIQARDAIHAAVMLNRGITRIMSADRGFDRIPGIERVF